MKLHLIAIGIFLGLIAGLLMVMHQDDKRHEEFYSWLNDPRAIEKLEKELQTGTTIYVSLNTVRVKRGPG